MESQFEPIMKAAFDHLVAAATISFTADGTADSAVLTNVTGPATLFEALGGGLFPGLPVFGPGVPAGALVLSTNATARTVTLTAPLGADATTGGAMQTGFLTTGRRVIHWTQVSDQPALFLRRTGVTDQADSLFTITTLECEIWIYCNAGQSPDIAPDEVLTGLETMVRSSLAADCHDDDGARFTLGGRVYWCRIEGHSDISPGDQGPQAIARIPLRITIP